MFHVDDFTQWLASHPDYGLFLSFMMAFAESMIFIGGIIPGSLAITAIGTLAGAGFLPIYPTLICAILGAIGGDFASFFVGRYFKEKLRDFFIFKKYPKTIQYGEYYFKKHGTKSVFFARFIGPIRAIVPAIAGMLDMKIYLFIFANTLSAIGWSILFYFPGVLIGRGHENIKENLTQIGFSILIFVIFPTLLVKLSYLFKRHVFPLYEKKINSFWQSLSKKYAIIHSITPKTHIQEYHITCSEFLILIFFISLTVLSYIFPIQYHSTQWLKIPSLTLFTHHRFLFAFDNLQGLGIIGLFIIFSVLEKQFNYLYVLVFMTLLQSPLYILNQPTAWVFSITFSLQYLILRTMSRNKMHLYQFFYIFFTMFWTLSTYLLSINLNMNMNPSLFLSMSLAQMCWILLRKKAIKTQYHQLWIYLFLIEPMVHFVRY